MDTSEKIVDRDRYVCEVSIIHMYFYSFVVNRNIDEWWRILGVWRYSSDINSISGSRICIVCGYIASNLDTNSDAEVILG